MLKASGSLSHFGTEEGGSIVVGGDGPNTRSALTRTGIMAPVARSKERCSIASRILVIAPECVLNEMKVAESFVNTSSKNFRRRAVRADSDSRESGSQNGSSSAKPSSIL